MATVPPRLTARPLEARCLCLPSVRSEASSPSSTPVTAKLRGASGWLGAVFFVTATSPRYGRKSRSPAYSRNEQQGLQKCLQRPISSSTSRPASDYTST
ncbi:hypothetical protein Cob_v011386 [Colletotrichum orbiculare MAFF 240422]|uniref:Uncharacterized protein n=1 Tax=Colletotrichum orbiculare (strain 104-T / ATCC 96160 / CBS 514.97 / LARS 414 / MAFF 240422) TaxID=1213857 RepID=A0A484FDS5_COLOR|nr:hypothetical protein Cob_v011386 [Colletotrichum orbiculare MAFF 240422]